MKWSTVWFAVACGAGYLAYHEYQAAQEQARVAYAAQQAEANLAAQAAAAGTCSPTDSIKQMASMWLAQFAAATTLSDLETFLQNVQAQYIPIVLDTWRANGLSLSLFTQLAQKLVPSV